MALASPLDKLAFGSTSFLTGIPIASAIISGAKSPSFLNESLSAGISFTFATTCFLISVTDSAGISEVGFIFLVTRSSVTSVTASSAATPLASDTSSVNSSPRTLFDASIALAGKNLFIYAANGTPESGLYSLIKSNIPRLPVSISSVSS